MRRDGDDLTVADGVVFPIISALSQFVRQDKSGTWILDVPSVFDEADMIDAARDQLSAHSGNPMLMGRNAAVYETLALLPKMIIRLTGRMKNQLAARN